MIINHGFNDIEFILLLQPSVFTNKNPSSDINPCVIFQLRYAWVSRSSWWFLSLNYAFYYSMKQFFVFHYVPSSSLYGFNYGSCFFNLGQYIFICYSFCPIYFSIRLQYHISNAARDLFSFSLIIHVSQAAAV